MAVDVGRFSPQEGGGAPLGAAPPEVLRSHRLGAKLRAVIRELRAGGIDSAALDARVLVAAALGLSPEDPFRRPDLALSGRQLAAIDRLISRRLRREPVAYILGRREFWSLDFEVDSTTLIPRPDSETLIEAALEAVSAVSGAGAPCTDKLSILDLGTGSGCLLLALLKEWPAAHGVGIDCQPGAVAVARRNAARHGLTSRASFYCRDWAAGLDRRFNLIITNPPYIATADLSRLPPDVFQYEPMVALAGGRDGLRAYRRLRGLFARCAEPGGIVVVEIGAFQAERVCEILFDQGPLSLLQLVHDLAGRPRCLVGRYEPGDSAETDTKNKQSGII